MNKFAFIAAVAAVSFYTVGAQAGGFGAARSNNNTSGAGLINVAPGVALGDLNVLNGLSILDKSPILSGNNTVIGNGLLNGIGIGLLGSGVGAGSAPVGILGGGNSYNDNVGNSIGNSIGNSFVKSIGNSYSMKKR